MRCLSTAPTTTKRMPVLIRLVPKQIGPSGTEVVFRQSLTTATAIVALLLLQARGSVFAGDPETARFRYSLTKTEVHRVPRFILEISNVPDRGKSKKWGESAKELCEEWFPVYCKFLSTEGWTPPEVVKIVIKTDMKVPGSTSGATISVNDGFITKHPEDFGMVMHELVHVLQHYPNSHKGAGWLIEGIADYLRYWKYESERPRRKLGENASYRDGYYTAGSFLAWIVWKYDRRAVRRLDAALRNGKYDDALFHKITGKDLAELWDEFVKHEHKRSE
jgi:Peptidase of plants and bacteria